MFAISNPHRAFEDAPIAYKALPRPSGKFSEDFRAFVVSCLSQPRGEFNPRQRSGMPPEPYCPPEGASATDLISRTEEMVHANDASWQWIYERLADADSKMLLLCILAYRSIGWQYTKLPLDNPKFWQVLQHLGQLQEQAEQKSRIRVGSFDLPFANFDLRKFGVDASVLTNDFGLFNEFIYSQYAYRGRRGILRPLKGECAIDCGACFGGTTLYLADLVGPAGKVLSFEFFPGNVEIFRRNLAANEHLAQRIELIESPVWHKFGETVSIEGTGPATQVYAAPNGSKALKQEILGVLGFGGNKHAKSPDQFITTTIDRAVQERRLKSVDFIKMDIEGAEFYALKGAENTLREFKPALAVCVYHKLIDFYELPQFIDSLGLGYKFYLQHSTPHGDETVLFADARGRDV